MSKDKTESTDLQDGSTHVDDDEVPGPSSAKFTQLDSALQRSAVASRRTTADTDTDNSSEYYPGFDMEEVEQEDLGQEDGDGEQFELTAEGRLREMQLRNATAEYLAGDLSLVDYATLLDRLTGSNYSTISGTEEAEEGTSSAPDEDKNRRDKRSRHQEEYVDTFGNIVRIEETDITDTLFTSKNPYEGIDSDAEEEGDDTHNAERSHVGFFHSGMEEKSFSLRLRKKLTTTLQRMLGQANLSYAQGDSEVAIKICMEIIKEQPTCVEPFQTLAMIYDNQGRTDKVLQYGLVAGLLDPKHFQEWPKLGELSLQENNLQQALMCYTKAVNNNPKNYELQLKQCEIYENLNDVKSALKGYIRILQIFPKEGKVCVEVLRKCAAIHHETENLERAYHSLEIAFKQYPDYITSAEVNLMLELCIALKKYVEAFKLLIKHCNVQFAPQLNLANVNTREALKILLSDKNIECVTSKTFNIDLVAKLVIILVHLEAFHMSDKLVDSVYQYNVEDFGDIYFDIAEAYMAKQNNAFALSLLTKLVHSNNFSLAAIWLRYAESLFLVSRLEEAAAAYEKVISLAPSHNLARLNLSVILQKLGKADAALSTLGEEYGDQPVDPELLMERCNILFDQGHYEEFIKNSMFLLSRHFPRIDSSADCQVFQLISNRGKKYYSLQNDRRSRLIHDEDVSLPFLDKSLDILSEWKVYLKLCHALLTKERYDLLTHVTHCAVSSKLFGGYQRTEREAEIQCYYSTILSDDPQDMLPYYNRLFLSNCIKSNTLLNLFGLAIRSGNPKRYGRHLIRLLQKYPNNTHLLLLRAHISFATYTYKNAVNEYQYLYKKMPKNPIIPLMLSSVYLHLMVQKANPLNRSRLSLTIIQLIFKYFELRGGSSSQEAFYNVGRLFHVLGFYNLAITYYKKVFETEPPIMERSSIGKGADNILDLKQETCFNLAQLYSSTGNCEMSRLYLNKIVI